MTDLAWMRPKLAARLELKNTILEIGDVAYVDLGGGVSAQIDASDVGLLSLRSSWRLGTGRNGKRYVVSKSRVDGKNFEVKLHRLLMGLDRDDSRKVDHIDGDTLNNRRSNLRICTVSENARNRGPTKQNSTGYKGVSFHKRSKKYVARICHLGERIHLGMFDTVVDAGRAYHAAARRLQGDFAWRPTCRT